MPNDNTDIMSDEKYLKGISTEKETGFGSKDDDAALGKNDLDVIFQRSEMNFDLPEFTIKELREVVPPHLFERSLLKSSVYLLGNLVTCAFIFYLATKIHSLRPVTLKFIAWPAYWWFEGIAATGIWVIAHECGHQAFCDSKSINNAVGLIFHSILLVPYHSWRISHAQHHSGTAHMDKDQVFVPKRRSHKSQALADALEEIPLYTFYTLMTYLTVGWPAYLIANKSGQKYPQYACHFLPSSPIFQKRHQNQVLLSDFGIIVVLFAIAYSAYLTSFWTVTKFYFIPYLLVNGWLVCITLLQHTDVYIPHYSAKTWSFVRGALSTVDRDYGWFLNHALHHIQDSHVAHHFFSQMPHYNAILATPYLRAKLGKYYLHDRTPICKALMRAIGSCVFVEDQGDVLFYKNSKSHYQTKTPKHC